MFSQACVTNSVHRRGVHLLGRHPLPPGRHLPPEMATKSGGTHPTGMHSSSFLPPGRGGGWLPSMHHCSHNQGGVCLLGFCIQGGVGQTPWDTWDIPQDMVNKWAVCILIKCILVVRCVYSVSKCLEMIGLHLTPGSTVTVWFMPNIAELLKPSTVKDFIFGQCELTIKLSIRTEHLFFFVVVSTVDLFHIV